MSVKLPAASSTVAGIATTGTQTIAGAKTFSSATTFSAGIVLGNETLTTYDEGTFTNTSASFSGVTTSGGSGFTCSGLYFRQIGKTVFCQIVSASWTSVALTTTSTGTITFDITGLTGLPSFTSKTAIGGSALWTIGSHSIAVAIVADTLGSTLIRMTQDVYTGQTGVMTTAGINFWYTL